VLLDTILTLLIGYVVLIADNEIVILSLVGGIVSLFVCKFVIRGTIDPLFESELIANS
jgi:hypothetical protein